MILKDHRKSLKRDPGGKENSIPGQREILPGNHPGNGGLSRVVAQDRPAETILFDVGFYAV